MVPSCNFYSARKKQSVEALESKKVQPALYERAQSTSVNYVEQNRTS